MAKIALPHEQSVGGALFQTMTQVKVHSDLVRFMSNKKSPIDRDLLRGDDRYDRV